MRRLETIRSRCSAKGALATAGAGVVFAALLLGGAALAGEAVPEKNGLPAKSLLADRNLRGNAKPDRPAIDCECRYAGGKAQVGQTICLRRNGSWVQARCEMTLNNTNWRILKDPCMPTS